MSAPLSSSSSSSSSNTLARKSSPGTSEHETEDESSSLLAIVRAQNPLRNPRAFPPDVISTCLHVDPRTLLALSVTSKTLRALITRDVVLRSLLESDGARYLARVSEPLRAESLGAVCPMPPLRLLRLALASRCENCFVDAEHLRCFLQVVVVVEKALNPTTERLLVQLRHDPDRRGPLRRSAAKLLAERHLRDDAWFLRTDVDEAAARAAASERTPWSSLLLVLSMALRRPLQQRSLPLRSTTTTIITTTMRQRLRLRRRRRRHHRRWRLLLLRRW
jgi:hypothetical protein